MALRLRFCLNHMAIPARLSKATSASTIPDPFMPVAASEVTEAVCTTGVVVGVVVGVVEGAVGVTVELLTAGALVAPDALSARTLN